MKTHVLLSALVVVATPDLAAPARPRAVVTDTPRERARRAAVPRGGRTLKGTARTMPASRSLGADEEKKEAKKSDEKKENKETGPAVKIKEAEKKNPSAKEAEKTEKSSKKSKSTKKSTKESKGDDGVEGATIPPLITNIFDMATGPPTMALVPNPTSPPTPNATVQTADSGCVLHADASPRGNSTAGPTSGKASTLPADVHCNSATVLGTTLTSLVVVCALAFA